MCETNKIEEKKPNKCDDNIKDNFKIFVNVILFWCIEIVELQNPLNFETKIN